MKLRRFLAALTAGILFFSSLNTEAVFADDVIISEQLSGQSDTLLYAEDTGEQLTEEDFAEAPEQAASEETYDEMSEDAVTGEPASEDGSRDTEQEDMQREDRQDDMTGPYDRSGTEPFNYMAEPVTDDEETGSFFSDVDILKDAGADAVTEEVRSEAVSGQSHYMNSGLSSVPKLSMKQLAALYGSAGSYSSLYSRTAVTSGSGYSPSKLSNEALSFSRNYINFYRAAAGLGSIRLTDEANESASWGALILAMIDRGLSHTPSKPADMKQDDYKKAYKATSQSNLSMSYNYPVAQVLKVAIDGQMSDDGWNRNVVGHRRWLLNPNTSNMGINTANVGNTYYTDVKVFGDHIATSQADDYNFIAFPASGDNLSDMLEADTAWSVTLNPKLYKAPSRSSVSVTLKNTDTGSSWVFDKSSSEDVNTKESFFTVDNNGYGISNCIIFNPPAGSFKRTGNYEVTVKGLKYTDGKDAVITYRVSLDTYENAKRYPEPVKVSSIKLSVNTKTAEAGEEFVIDATVQPSNADCSVLEWESGNPGVAEVDINGRVKAKTAGTAVITASAIDGSGVSASCTVTVIPVQVKSITLDKTRLRMEKGDKETLTAAVLPENAADKRVTWKSGNESVATVDASGNVTAKGDGTAVVTAKAGSCTAECTVIVRDRLMSAAPTAGREPGEVVKGTKILLCCETPGASIYYTLDGSTPDPGRAVKSGSTGTILYEDAIEITGDTVIKAVSVCDGFRMSEMSVFAYRMKADWGDIDSSLRNLFDDNVNGIPDGLWYSFGDGKIYTASSETGVRKTYNGSKITFNREIAVFYRNTRLSENRDYKLTYANNLMAAAATDAKAPSVSVVGMNNYGNKAVFKYSIIKEDLNAAVLSTSAHVSVKSGALLKTIVPTVMYRGKKLKKGVDYDCVYYKGSVPGGIRVNDSVPVKTEDGRYEIVITAHNGGNFAGTLSDTVTVEAYDIRNKTVTEMKKVKASVPQISWTGSAVDIRELFDNSNGKKSGATVKKGTYTLIYGEDFTVEGLPGDDYRSAGDHSVVLRGTDADNASSFVGDRAVSFKIAGISASKVKISGLNSAPEYTGGVITLKDLSTGDISSGTGGIKLYTTEKGISTTLSSDDYDVDLSQAGASGSFTVSFILKNGYTGTVVKKIKVKPYNIGNDIRHEVGVDCSGCIYSKGGAMPDVRVTCAGRLLREGIDYTLSYSNNKSLSGQSTVTVKGKGHYTGSVRIPFSISKAGTDRLILSADDKDYKKNAGAGYFKVLPKVMDNGTALSNGKDISKITVKDCRYFYADSGDEIPDKEVVAPGTVIEVRANISCPADSPYSGSTELRTRYRIIPKENNIKKAKVTVNKESALYFDDGNEVVPDKSVFAVKMGSTILKNSEYDIVSIRNNRFIGTVTVEIAGKGKYGGKKKVTLPLNKRKLL